MVGPSPSRPCSPAPVVAGVGAVSVVASVVATAGASEAEAAVGASAADEVGLAAAGEGGGLLLGLLGLKGLLCKLWLWLRLRPSRRRIDRTRRGLYRLRIAHP